MDALREPAVPEAVLTQLEALKDKPFGNRRELLHELSGVLDRAGITDKSEREFLQVFLPARAAIVDKHLCFTEEALTATREWKVPDPVFPPLEAPDGDRVRDRAPLCKRGWVVFSPRPTLLIGPSARRCRSSSLAGPIRKSGRRLRCLPSSEPIPRSSTSS